MVSKGHLLHEEILIVGHGEKDSLAAVFIGVTDSSDNRSAGRERFSCSSDHPAHGDGLAFVFFEVVADCSAPSSIACKRPEGIGCHFTAEAFEFPVRYGVKGKHDILRIAQLGISTFREASAWKNLGHRFTRLPSLRRVGKVFPIYGAESAKFMRIIIAIRAGMSYSQAEGIPSSFRREWVRQKVIFSSLSLLVAQISGQGMEKALHSLWYSSFLTV